MLSPMMRPCEQLAIADKGDCPNYGSSDCSINPTWGICNMTLSELVDVIRHKGGKDERIRSDGAKTFCGNPFPPCPLCGCGCDVHGDSGNGEIRCPGCGLILPFGFSQVLKTPHEAAERWVARRGYAPEGYVIVPKPEQALIDMREPKVSSNGDGIKCSIESEILRPSIDSWLRGMDIAFLKELLSSAKVIAEQHEEK